MNIVNLTLIFTALPILYYVFLRIHNIIFDILKYKMEISYYKQQNFESGLRLIGVVLYPILISMIIGILCYLFKVDKVIIRIIDMVAYIAFYIYMGVSIKKSDVKGNLSNRGGLYWKLNNINRNDYNYKKLIPFLIIITVCFSSITYHLFKYINTHDTNTLIYLISFALGSLFFINVIWGYLSIEVGLYNSRKVKIYLDKENYMEGKILSMENGLILFLPLYCAKPFYFNENLVESVEVISVNNKNNKSWFNKVFNLFD